MKLWLATFHAVIAIGCIVPAIVLVDEAVTWPFWVAGLGNGCQAVRDFYR